MYINLNKLKKYEVRAEKATEDPAKIIQIIKKIIEMGSCDTDGSWIIAPPIADEQKVTFFEYVKYFGNYQIERAEENRWDVEEIKATFDFKGMEERIKAIDGFSDYSLPEGTVIKYR